MLSPRTVIEAFLPAKGQVRLDRIYNTANAAGIDDQPLRLAIRRMISAGEVVQTGRGRHGTLSLTEAGRERLDRDRLGLRLAFAQDQGRAPWDRRWHLLAVSVPESERAVRDAIRRRLVEAGAAPVSTGLYLSPHDLAPMYGAISHDNLVQATTTDLNVRGLADPLLISELLWPASPIVARYAIVERIATETESFAATDVDSVLVQQLRLADALERAMRNDPLIPLELRAGHWPPSRIRRTWYEAWATLATRLPHPLLYRGWLISETT